MRNELTQLSHMLAVLSNDLVVEKKAAMVTGPPLKDLTKLVIQAIKASP